MIETSIKQLIKFHSTWIHDSNNQETLKMMTIRELLDYKEYFTSELYDENLCLDHMRVPETVDNEILRRRKCNLLNDIPEELKLEVLLIDGEYK